MTSLSSPVTPACTPLALAGLKRVHDSPPVYLVEDFLTDEECQALIETAAPPVLQRSKTHAAAGSEATKGTSLT